MLGRKTPGKKARIESVFSKLGLQDKDILGLFLNNIRGSLQDFERQVRSDPELVARLSLRAARQPGHPKGVRSIDPLEAFMIAIAVDVWGFRRVEVLQAVGRLPNESRSYYRWINERLEFARPRFQKSLSRFREELAPRAQELQSEPKTQRQAFLKRLLDLRS